VATGASDTLELLTRQELAYRLGVNPQTVTKWIEEGLPVAARGKGRRPSRYEEASVRRWVAAHEKATDGRAPTSGAGSKPANGVATNLVEARARKELAQAVEAEQRVAIRAAKLIPIEDVDQIWSTQVAAVRARLLAIPVALTDRVLRVGALEGAAAAERALQEAIYEALRELSGDVAPVKTRRSKKRQVRKTTTRKQAAK